MAKTLRNGTPKIKNKQVWYKIFPKYENVRLMTLTITHSGLLYFENIPLIRSSLEQNANRNFQHFPSIHPCYQGPL